MVCSIYSVVSEQDEAGVGSWITFHEKYETVDAGLYECIGYFNACRYGADCLLQSSMSHHLAVHRDHDLTLRTMRH